LKTKGLRENAETRGEIVRYMYHKGRSAFPRRPGNRRLRFFIVRHEFDNSESKEEPMISTTLARTKANLRAAGMASTSLGLIMGITPSTMRSATAGTAYLGSEAEAKLLETSSTILALAEALRPLELRDWQAWKQLLASRVEPEAIREWVQVHF
jgi:hypothetical protein